jgi:hypothetical protein
MLSRFALVEPLFRRFGHGLVMNHLDGLHDRVEMIECCVGLGLMVSAFVLAVWLLPL